MALGREEILRAKDLKIEEVQVPEWGGTVFVKGLGATAKERFAQERMDSDGKPNIVGFRATFAAASIVDEHGKPIFTGADIEALGEHAEEALDRILEVGQRLSKVSLAAVEAEVGNSSGGQSADSTSV
jgi:hypothetical protein